MAATRLWVLIASAVLALVAALSLARAAGESAPGDFLVLAIKPEGDLKDYRMVPIGETAVDPVQYRDVVKSLPRSLFGGPIVRPYDERAELAQCRTACAANAKCGNFTYVRPGKDRPVGVCHLRRVVDQPNTLASPAVAAPAVASPAVPAPTVAMTPVVENAAPQTEVVVVSPPLRKERPLVTVDSTRNGRTLYTPDDAPATPVMFKFKVPVASAKIDVKTQTRQRVFANIEALDAKGRVFKRSGMWIAADGGSHQLLVRTEGDRISAARITTREAGALIVSGVDFVRSAKTVESAPVEDPVAGEPVEADVPPPVPDVVAEALPTPPRGAATDAPAADVAEAPPAAAGETIVAELPADAEATSITLPINPPAESPAPESTTVEAPAPAAPVITPIPVPADEPQEPPVPLWLAAGGAAAFMLGGVGLYRQNYRRRTLARLTTSVLSDGLDRQAVLTTGDEPDLSLRFSIRMPADVSARQTIITITPDGEAA